LLPFFPNDAGHLVGVLLLYEERSFPSNLIYFCLFLKIHGELGIGSR